MQQTSTYSLRSLIVCLAGSLAVSCGSNPPPPVIDAISPAALCELNGTRGYTLTGTGFLKNDMLPTVTFTNISSMQSVTTQASEASGCEGQNCTSLSVSLSASELPAGTYNVVVKNNCTLDTCISAQIGPPAQVVVVAAPTLTAVTPTVMCQGQGSLTLTGSKLYAGAVVSVGAAKSTSLTVSSDGLSATAMFSGMLPLSSMNQTTLAYDPQDVTIENVPGCSASLPAAVTVTPGPAILFVDPPVVPANYSIAATVYAASVASPVSSVQIAPAGTSNYTTLTINTDPLRPNRVLVTLPGNLSAGSYDLKLNDQTTCSASLPSAIKVVATPTLTVNTPTPSFGALSANTAVSVTGTGFVSTPRAYVAVNGGASGVSASALRAVTFSSATALTAVVPSGLGAGTYDLIVVNPNGSYGIKTAAFVVTQMNQPPPVVTGISPSSVVVATNAAITVLGNNFRTPTLVPSCYDASNVLLGGAMANVMTSSATSISATLNAPANSIYCTLRVRDGDNNTFFDYSAIGVTNAGLNLTGFKATANSLVTARRAPAAAAGRPTQVARYVYVAGGDNGTNNNPLSSVEVASSGLDGTLSTFSTVSQPLPKALSFHGMVNVGRFLYVVGGFDGTAASKAVYRAELLDPLNAPQFSDVDVRPDMTQGIAPGVYSYRISAVMGTGDANNPGGETLASDFFPVQIPTLSMGSLQLVLYFKQVPGAQSYKIYRTLNAGDAAGNERLLATVNDNGQATQSYIDDGKTAPAGASPLPLGSIGAWKTLASLNTARVGAGVVAAPDPTTAGTFYLYALGGNSGTLTTVTTLSSVEFLTITLTGGGAGQTTAASWTNATNSLPTARWLGPGLFATKEQNSNVAAASTFIYQSSGISSDLATATLSKPVYVASVGAAGQPGTFADSGSVGVNGAGFGAALVNNQMYAFGGLQGGTPSTASVSANLSAGPTLANFNALGSGTLTVARALHGTAIESAFIYQLGGLGAGATVLRSAEQTIW